MSCASTNGWLTRRAAEILGPSFDLEVIEMHHRHKKDAPSGTATTLLEILGSVRQVQLNEALRHGRQIVRQNDPRRRHYVPDRERGALKRLAALMKGRSGLWFYHQGDPRGCALYVGKVADLGGLPVDQAYNRGVAVCY